MKILRNHVIVYDEECPMCNLYTSAFVQCGILEENGRMAYNQMGKEIADSIDKDRARNEIALVDTEAGTVTYGLESLYKVIAQPLPFLWPLFRFRPFNFIMKKIYFFISYNRKVLVPSAETGSNSCIPDINIKYRIAFIVVAWFISAFLLNVYSARLVPLLPSSSLWRELMICGGQLVFQGLLIILLKEKKVLEYIGNVMAVSLIGSLLLLPALWFPYSETLLSNVGYVAYFLLVVGFLLLEHTRRVKLLKLPFVLTFGWLGYRLIVLLILF
jgi:predicted DCC family thiol-disulfide oxidoreductase YuxK